MLTPRALLAVPFALSLPACGGWSSPTQPTPAPTPTPPPVVAQYTVIGVVSDDVSNAPISGATIRLSTGQSSSTDANGYYAITPVAGGAIGSTVTAPGFLISFVLGAFLIGLFAALGSHAPPR